MDQFVRGAIVAGCLVVGLFFLRFFRRTWDRLFLFFALSFFLLAAERFMLALVAAYATSADITFWLHAFPYWVRAFAYLLIIVGIIDKNVSGRSETPA